MFPLIVVLGIGLVLYFVLKSKSATGTGHRTKAKSEQVRTLAAPGGGADLKFEISIETNYGSGSSSRGNVDASVRADDLWIRAGESVEIHGLKIKGGMLYVGKGLGAVAEYHGLEPALVNPALSVNLSAPDLEGKSLNYWPSYDAIPPRARAAYLMWLAGGRSDPNAPLGYVFLFFYGLERRLLMDARISTAAKSEVSALIEEVVRLRSIYQENNSFNRYSSTLLQTCRVIHSSGKLGDGEPPSRSTGYGFPIDLVAGLGERLVAEKPITGPWAFSWYMQDPETRIRTPATRCSAEFEKLFLLRFQEKYPNGLKLKPNKRQLVCEHTAASSGLGGIRLELDGLPDVRGLSGPAKKFAAIADACSHELDAYSRYLGRNPDAAGSLQAYALLPAPLAGADEPVDARELADWINGKLLAKERTLVPAKELMARWVHEHSGKFSKKEAVAFSQVLDRLGFGVEPDARFGGPPVKAEGELVLFRLGSKPMSTASREYGAATILLHLAAIVAAADGVVSEEEETHLEQHLEQAMQLDEGERVRLRAHLDWLLTEPPGTAGLKKRLESLSPQLKQQVAEFAVSVAGADGRIDPAEVTALQKLYKMIGLDPESVFSDIHALTAAPATGPVTVALGQRGPSGRKLPPAPGSSERAEPSRSFELNMDRVREKMRDTAEVASLLSGIFVEEEATVSAPSMKEESGAEPSSLGLDRSHLQLLNSLKGISQLARQDFEQRCAQLDLLPDGALDALNEAAFESCDAALLMGDDPLEVDVDIFSEMCA